MAITLAGVPFASLAISASGINDEPPCFGAEGQCTAPGFIAVQLTCKGSAGSAGKVARASACARSWTARTRKIRTAERMWAASQRHPDRQSCTALSARCSAARSRASANVVRAEARSVAQAIIANLLFTLSWNARLRLRPVWGFKGAEYGRAWKGPPRRAARPSAAQLDAAQRCREAHVGAISRGVPRRRSRELGRAAPTVD